MTDRVACAIRTLSKPDTVSAAENWGDKDPAWAAVATQLCRTVGTADRATVLATAGLALREINHVLRALPGGGPGARPPSTLDTTLEFDVSTGSLTARRWSAHPQCAC
ncbi:hypothetical protein [Mycolicibacterium chlorophenolicum]|uniref:Bacteriocin biosynthesis cyclodehydratase domain protein n=1 Tax=Mycolicibacterium chlorophenolicum TaxID=37916 RepID=A0A0J6VR74_9MYCO|nr:hypothetical protein [Mycolicibacterium chlorophenolicum]KMO72684.1 hypothetical protein MCHLDSM_03903 [Mycolicibacterium chlorophenolicum]